MMVSLARKLAEVVHDGQPGPIGHGGMGVGARACCSPPLSSARMATVRCHGARRPSLGFIVVRRRDSGRLGPIAQRSASSALGASSAGFDASAGAFAVSILAGAGCGRVASRRCRRWQPEVVDCRLLGGRAFRLAFSGVCSARLPPSQLLYARRMSLRSWAWTCGELESRCLRVLLLCCAWWLFWAIVIASSVVGPFISV